MKAEAEEIRKKAFEEGELKGQKEGLVAGKIIGFDKGKKEEKIEIVKEMLNQNSDMDFIVKVTKLTIEEIERIKKEVGFKYKK